MDHHQREQRRAAAEAFNQSLEQLAACFQAEDLSPTDFLASAAPDAADEQPDAQIPTEITAAASPSVAPLPMAPLTPEELPGRRQHS